MQETRAQSLGQEDPLEKKWQHTPVFLPRKSHGQRSLAGYSPWGHKSVRHNLVTKEQQNINSAVYSSSFVFKSQPSLGKI